MCLTGAEPAQADRRGSQLLLAFFNPRLLPMAQKMQGRLQCGSIAAEGVGGLEPPAPTLDVPLVLLY